MNLRDHFRRTERTGELCVARAGLHVIHAVAQHDADRIVAVGQIGSEIERVIETSLVVFRPARSEQDVADFYAVRRQFVLAKTADVNRRTLQTGVDRELPAKNWQTGLHGHTSSPRTDAESA